MSETKGKANRLINESSPYLLQHAYNPVDWFPWGEEALEKARQENKPILLSVGYSACHWCHVMERESFEDERIARLMNEHFVSIKVDREERPDLDELYMNAIQLMTGSGGWPMTVFLTPGLVPFHGGTYFPPEDRQGIPGFPRVLKTISEYYRDHKEEVGRVAAQMGQALSQMAGMVPSGQEGPGEEILSRGVDALREQFDALHGGFGGAPKFPPPMALSFLLRIWRRTGDRTTLDMVARTLDRMADGGIHDHLGGGFHRYAVDERWLVPHFEKMLYDNALLSKVYGEAFRATGNERYRRVAEDVLDYVLREMRSPDGGFFSALDADSGGEEGTFYVWTREEIDALLGREKGTAFCDLYGVSAQGNFEGDRSVLARTASPEKVSGLYGLSPEALEGIETESRARLFAERAKRVAPGRDDKILASWNGLMISGFVEGYRVSGRPEFLDAAVEAGRFILRAMSREGDLLRVYKGQQARTSANAEDYACFVQALLDLHEVTFDDAWVDEAIQFSRRMIERFWDRENGGFFFTGEGDGSLIVRSKHPYDQTLPSPNSVAVFNLVRLGLLTGAGDLVRRAEAILRLFGDSLADHPAAFPHMLSAFSFFKAPEEVTVTGSPDDVKTRSMAGLIRRAYLPNAVVRLRQAGASDSPVVQICKGSTCLPPLKDEIALRDYLAGL
jgi:uncharacterized protein